MTRVEKKLCHENNMKKIFQNGKNEFYHASSYIV